MNEVAKAGRPLSENDVVRWFTGAESPEALQEYVAEIARDNPEIVRVDWTGQLGYSSE